MESGGVKHSLATGWSKESRGAGMKRQSRTATEWEEDIDAAVDAILARRSELVREHSALVAERDELARGTFYEHASIWKREGRWAYLHVRRPKGGRDRRYIGIDAKKIAAVEASIARGARYTQVVALLAQYEHDAAKWARALLSIARDGRPTGHRPTGHN